MKCLQWMTPQLLDIKEEDIHEEFWQLAIQGIISSKLQQKLEKWIMLLPRMQNFSV